MMADLPCRLQHHGNDRLMAAELPGCLQHLQIKRGMMAV